MTAQTTEAVDKAFWDLICNDPDLLDAAFHSLTDLPAEPTGPGDRPPTGGPGDANHHPRPRTSDAQAPPASLDHSPRKVTGRVRSPPRLGHRRQGIPRVGGGPE
ncbi:hypothetical protein ACH4E7_25910 [Kitasatospora sp. NPDC018058]|uniref:hypothetical protein n=1 Tax=Kitasatospora sp. NPDC018058 TaxID=3364025 RepID=UPI0037BE9E85